MWWFILVCALIASVMMNIAGQFTIAKSSLVVEELSYANRKLADRHYITLQRMLSQNALAKENEELKKLLKGLEERVECETGLINRHVRRIKEQIEAIENDANRVAENDMNSTTEKEV